MAVELNGSEGRHADSAPPSDGLRGAAAYAAARALLASVFVAYTATLLASVLGLSPLARPALARALLAAALLAGLLVHRASPAEPRCDVPIDALARVGRLALATGLGAAAIDALLAVHLPIGAYDALGYRLPAVAQWLDAGAVVWVSGDDPLRNGYPLGLEVVEALIFAALGSPAAVDAAAIPLLLAGALSLLGLVEELRAARGAGQLAAGLFLLAPVHLLNAPSGYADAAFAGAVVAQLVAAARWITSCERKRHAASDLGIASALVVALKPHGFALTGLALAVAAAFRVREIGAARAVATLLPSAVLATPGFFFAGRNLARTGNPIYPLEVRGFGRVLLPGEASLDGILTPSFNVPVELADVPGLLRPWIVFLQPHGPARSFDDRLAGFGYAFALLALPALVWALVRVLRGRAPRGLTYVALVTLAAFAAQPLAFWPRFSSWMWGAAGLSLALLLSELRAHGRNRGALALSSLALALAAPEAAYALAHVKRLDVLGLAILRADPVEALAQVSGVDAGFVRRALVGRRDVCRTPWRLGTDDANLDGVVAQLAPRPRMHVIDEPSLEAVRLALRARGCEELIVIGDHPLVARILGSEPSGSARVVPATAFGRLHLVSLSPLEVSP